MQCHVCKQEIKEGESVVYVDGQAVHSGVCQTHLNEVKANLSESEGSNIIAETELLM